MYNKCSLFLFTINCHWLGHPFMRFWISIQPSIQPSACYTQKFSMKEQYYFNAFFFHGTIQKGKWKNDTTHVICTYFLCKNVIRILHGNAKEKLEFMKNHFWFKTLLKSLIFLAKVFKNYCETCTEPLIAEPFPPPTVQLKQ